MLVLLEVFTGPCIDFICNDEMFPAEEIARSAFVISPFRKRPASWNTPAGFQEQDWSDAAIPLSEPQSFDPNSFNA